MGVKDQMMNRMVDKMSKEEKAEMMESMMSKFFEDFTPEEKQDLVMKMMPMMMENMDLSQMMGGMMRGEEFQMSGAMESTSRTSDGEDFPPWKMCEKMVGGMREMVDTNKAILEELRKRPI